MKNFELKNMKTRILMTYEILILIFIYLTKLMNFYHQITIELIFIIFMEKMDNSFNSQIVDY